VNTHDPCDHSRGLSGTPPWGHENGYWPPSIISIYKHNLSNG
jgi:hypothetical protein